MAQEQDNTIDTYDRLASINPPRVPPKDNGDNGNGDGNGDGSSPSMKQMMKIAPKMSDFQVLDKRLFPVLKEGLEWLNNIMVGRVFPETFNPLRNIIAKHLLQEYPDMSVAEALSIAEVALTVPLDGEGRLDLIHSHANMSNNDEDKDKNKLG